MGWVVNATPLAALPIGMTRCLLYMSLGGLQGRSGRMREISSTLGFDPRTVQPLASRYTDWAIPDALIRKEGYPNFTKIFE